MSPSPPAAPKIDFGARCACSHTNSARRVPSAPPPLVSPCSRVDLPLSPSLFPSPRHLPWPVCGLHLLVPCRVASNLRPIAVEQEVEILKLCKSIVEDGPDLFSLHKPSVDAPFRCVRRKMKRE